MNIHRRFTLLVIGAVLTPLTTAALLFTILNPDPPPAALRLFMHGERTVLEAEAVIETLPTSAIVRLLSAAELESMGLGAALAIDDAADATTDRAAATTSSRPRTFTVIVKPLSEAADRRPGDPDRAALLILSPVAPSQLRTVAALSLGLIFVFTSIVAVFTVRAIRRSMRVLEDATASVASGGLDFAIDIPKGDSFYPLAQSFDRMRIRIREEQDRRTRFFMGVSHDLKTPLASITGFAEALLDGYDENTADRRRYLTIIRDKAQVLQERLGRLIDYVRHATGEFQSALAPHDLTAYLRDFVAFQMEDAQLHGWQLAAEIALPAPLLVPFDPDLLTRALENVVGNAWRHGGSSGARADDTPVRFVAELAPDRTAVLIVCTNHLRTPLPAATLERLFEPFYRGDPARSGDGFGLGLSSTKAIIENHGWSIRIDAVDSTFRVVVRVPYLHPRSPDTSAI